MCHATDPLASAVDAELAAEWEMFQAVEAGTASGAWRVWEAPGPAVCVGRRGSVGQVHEPACLDDGVPVVRRESGGGAVVLGAGCLNYALVVPLTLRADLLDVAESFQIILGQLARALGLPGLGVAGTTDLALSGHKVSGNAQRRGRRALLHHGTLLYGFDASLATRYLAEPERQPTYRARRRHADFLGNLPLSADRLRRAVRHVAEVLTGERAAPAPASVARGTPAPPTGTRAPNCRSAS